jgi:tetratricopeptide (TPR) repeat protein
MTNPLQRPTMQHLLTSLGAVAAGVVLPSYFSKEWSMAAATASAVGGIGGNLISNFLAKFFDHREADPTRPDINGDLLKLVSNAIAKEIADCSRDDTLPIDKPERNRLFALANKTAGAFEQLMHDEELPDIAPPDVKQLLTDAARDQALPPVGKVEGWRRLVARLANHCNVGLNINTMVLLAQKLHTHLWESIRSELKKDFTADGRAYAALHLAFMGDVLATLHTMVALPREQTQLTQALLEELRAHKTREADAKERTIIATLTPEDHTRLSPLIERLYGLGIQLEAHIGRVLNELTSMEQSAQQRHGVTQKRLYWLLTGIVLLTVGGGGATCWLRQGQNEQRQETQQVGEKIDDALAILLSLQSAKDQEIGQLKADKTQLEAALQRAAQAQMQGDTTATEALAELRKDGDPKKLGTFLDQQLAEKQPDVIALLRERAAVAYVSGEIDRSEQCLRQILATLPEDLDATNRLGWIYQLHGDLDAASRQYHRLLELAPDDQSWKAAALGNLGLIAQTRGQLDEAERLYNEALAINKQLSRLEGQAIALGNLGVIAQTRGQLDEAERFHRDALTINQQLRRLEGQAKQLSNLGILAQTRGQLDEAEHFHRDALAMHKRLKQLEGQASDLGNLGLIAYTRNQPDNAERLFCEALDLEKKLKRPEGQALQLRNLGLIAQARNQLEDAERLLLDALSLFERMDHSEGQAIILNELGVIVQARGQLNEAERLYRKALAINKTLDRLEGQANQLGNLGGIAKQRGNLAEARRLWTEGRDLFARVGAKPQQEQTQQLLDALPPG